MEHYAEPEIPTVLSQQHHATRALMASELAWQKNPSVEVAPLSDAAPLNTSAETGGGGGGSGGSGGSSSDTTGSFGPNQGYGLPPGGYVVDITDCQVAVNALTAGSLVAGGTGTSPTGSFHCVVTARGRLDPIGSAAERSWALGTRTVKQGVYSSAHDARAEIITPEMVLE